jgi:hypothetical protein
MGAEHAEERLSQTLRGNTPGTATKGKGPSG